MWILSKLISPAPLHKSIQRQRILTELDKAHQYKLVLFQSPAGFGKTTMAAQWLAKLKNVGWFSIDSADNDPFDFANYFIKALNNATNGSCSKASAMAQKNQFHHLQGLFDLVLGELSSWKDQAYLMLDDYHLITDKEIHKAIKHFIKHIPPNLTLVITSRSQPPLGIANLRVRCQLLEVDIESLAFDNEETYRFLSQFNPALSDEKLCHNFCTQVEGWASALQLIAINSHKSQNVPSLTSNSTLHHLWDYLAEEVFDQFDQPSREFLMQCAILSRFNHELISVVTEQPDALTKMNKFDQNGIFISLIDSKDRWYRFHNLFAEFLTHQRRRLMPEKEEQLLARAVNAWLLVNNPEQALDCALKSKQQNLKVTVLLDHGWHLFNQGNIRLLNEALKNIDPEQLYSQPRLFLMQAWLLQVQYRHEEVSELLEHALQEMAAQHIVLNSTEQGEIYALMAQVAISQNKAAQALELSEKAFEHLSSPTYHSRIVATSVVGEVHHCYGQLNRALPLMQQTEKLARQHEFYQQALWALLQQSEIHIARGMTNEGAERLEKAQELVKLHHLEQLPLYAFLLRLQSRLMWNLYRLDESQALAKQSLEVVSYYSPIRTIPAFTQLANINLLKGQLDKAEHNLKQCEKLLAQADHHIDWHANFYMAQLWLWQVKEDKNKAAIWLKTAEIPETVTNHFLQLQSRNLARAHFICANYTQAKSILLSNIHVCQKLELVTDHQYNLTFLTSVLEKLGQKKEAEQACINAINLLITTGMSACFYIEYKSITPVLHRILQNKKVEQIINYQASSLFDSISRLNTQKTQHFNETLIKKILTSNNLPQALRQSALTLREWQVLGLIYSGLSNEKISLELSVAATTTKSHIRNLYQKLQIKNRNQAIAIADKLLKNVA